MLTVACVLKSGGRYDEKWVYRLRDMVDRWLWTDYEFWCLTDLPHIPGIPTKPLTMDLRGFWSKIELFTPGLFTGQVLYLDLDVVITQPIHELVQAVPFITIKDWQTQKINSSVICWTADHPKPARIYQQFDTSKMAKLYGDQDWMSVVIQNPVYYPENWIVSYKKNVRGQGLSPDAKVVVFHGEPKQDKVDEPWVTSNWV